MNRRYVLVLALCAVVFTGCATWEKQQVITPLRVERVSRLAAYVTVRSALLERPEVRFEMEKAHAGFLELMASENWDITTAAAIAMANGLPILNSSEGNLIFDGVIMFVDIIGGDKVNLKNNEYAKAVITGVAGGLSMGLARNVQREIITPTEIRLQTEAQAVRK